MTKPEPRKYYPCTDKMWLEVGREECARRMISPREFFAGNRGTVYTSARWAAWTRLMQMGCSYKGIGDTAGFDHTSVRHAIISCREPYPNGQPGRKRIRPKSNAKPQLINMPKLPPELRQQMGAR